MQEIDSLQRKYAEQIMELQSMLNQSDQVRRELEAQVRDWGAWGLGFRVCGVWVNGGRQSLGFGIKFSGFGTAGGGLSCSTLNLEA